MRRSAEGSDTGALACRGNLNRKAAQQHRTPKRGAIGSPCFALAFWSAAVVCRFRMRAGVAVKAADGSPRNLASGALALQFGL
jgi:hypothetical protein